jgi:hypothetical protein
MMSALYPTSGAHGLWVFLLVTVVMGGAAAIATGRAIAATWRPWWQVAAYALLLAAAVRFLQYALFQQPLLSMPNFLVDAALLIALGLLGHRHARACQMSVQYPWLFVRRGRFGWQPKDGRSG